MANFLHMFVPLLVTFLLINVSLGDLSSRKIVGGWQAVDPKNATIEEIGKFAVSEYDKKLKGKEGVLKYKEVVKAAKQVVNGINYRLIIAATNGTETNKYQAAVLEQPGVKHMRNLTSFVPAKKELY